VAADVSVALAESGLAGRARDRIAANLARWPNDLWVRIQAGDALAAWATPRSKEHFDAALRMADERTTSPLRRGDSPTGTTGGPQASTADAAASARTQEKAQQGRANAKVAAAVTCESAGQNRPARGPPNRGVTGRGVPSLTRSSVGPAARAGSSGRRSRIRWPQRGRRSPSAWR
jgi:hypothetical protein